MITLCCWILCSYRKQEKKELNLGNYTKTKNNNKKVAIAIAIAAALGISSNNCSSCNQLHGMI